MPRDIKIRRLAAVKCAQRRSPEHRIRLPGVFPAVIAHVQHKRLAGPHVRFPVPQISLPAAENLVSPLQKLGREFVNSADPTECGAVEEDVGSGTENEEGTDEWRLIQLDRKSVV